MPALVPFNGFEAEDRQEDTSNRSAQRAAGASQVEREILSLITDIANESEQTKSIPESLRCAVDVFRTDGKRQAEELLRRWIHLEDDPELVAADCVMYNQEVDESISSAFDSEIDISINNSSSDLGIQDDQIFLTKLNVLNSLNDALSCPMLNNPIFVDLATKLRDHITENC